MVQDEPARRVRQILGVGCRGMGQIVAEFVRIRRMCHIDPKSNDFGYAWN